MDSVRSATLPTRRGDHLARGARTAYGINALLAWSGFLLVTALSATNSYDEVPPVGHVYGRHVDGAAGVVSRLSDHVSYFTEWSSLVVAISTTLLALAPTRATLLRRVLRLDSLLMITVTAIVYAVLLAPKAVVTGWSVLTNPWQHIVVPAVTVIVFLGWGPRGWIDGKVVAWSLALPVAWLAWALVRGAIVGSYPYAFLDVATYGYASVFQTIAMILAFGLAVALGYWGIDRLLSRARAA